MSRTDLDLVLDLSNYFFEYYDEQINGITFQKRHFALFKTHHEKTFKRINNELLNNEEMCYENFMIDFIDVYLNFKKKVLDNDANFYKLKNIEIFYKYLKCINSDSFCINNVEVPENQKRKLEEIKNQMDTVFKQNNIKKPDTTNPYNLRNKNSSSNENIKLLINREISDLKDSILNELKSQLIELTSSLKADNQTKLSTNVDGNSEKTVEKFDDYFNEIKKNFNKKLRYNFHVNQFEKHLQNSTCPQSLNYDRFPIPFLQDDENFVNKYNQLIETFQRDTMALCIESLRERVDKIDSYLLEVKDKLKDSEANIEQKFENIEKSVNTSLEKFFKHKEYKYRHTSLNKFKVKTTNSEKNNENVENNNTQKYVKNQSQNSSNGFSRKPKFQSNHYQNKNFTRSRTNLYVNNRNRYSSGYRFQSSTRNTIFANSNDVLRKNNFKSNYQKNTFNNRVNQVNFRKRKQMSSFQ